MGDTGPGAVRVRRLDTHEIGLLRSLRLAALADTPAAFGSTLEREAALADDDWRLRLATAGAVTLVAERDGEGVGMVTGVLDDDPSLVHLYGLWVAARERGRGTADALVVDLVGWARRRGAGVVRLHVTEGNGRAERFYERHGFRRTGESFVRDRDGLAEIEMDLVLAEI